MTKYIAYVSATVNDYFEVEAEDDEKAYDEAERICRTMERVEGEPFGVDEIVESSVQ